jgi:transposase
MLEKFDKQICELLDKGYITTVIFERLKQIGYQGSLTTLYRYVKQIKPKVSKQTTRFETAPGEQIQYDWKEWKLNVAGKIIKLYIHSFVLGYSRKKFYTFSLDITLESIMHAIYESTIFFGGYCKFILIDNPKQMISDPRTNKTPACFLEKFLSFCISLGVMPYDCKTYRAQTKGKVERPFFYLQEHLLRGLEVDSLEDFKRRLFEFTSKYNARIHSKLNQSPDKRFEIEKLHITPLPHFDPQIFFVKETRKVSSDGYIHYKGRMYPVPMLYCNQILLVEPISGIKIKIYNQKAVLVSEHNIDLHSDKIRPEHPEHIIINQKYLQKRKRLYSKTVERFIDIFGDTGKDFIQGLYNLTNINAYYHIAQILQYNDIYGKQTVNNAIKSCISIKAFSKDSVKHFLSTASVDTSHINASNTSYNTGKIIADLNIYRNIL